MGTSSSLRNRRTVQLQGYVLLHWVGEYANSATRSDTKRMFVSSRSATILSFTLSGRSRGSAGGGVDFAPRAENATTPARPPFGARDRDLRAENGERARTRG
jgi:hypothetical protein